MRQLERLGYKVEHRERVAANTGTPTIRKRLYIIARRDGRPIVWPAPTHAKAPSAKLKPWRTAAECIDWTLQGRSIFNRPKPLAINTLRRVARGCWRYVLDSDRPFVLTNTTGHPGASVDEPLRTVTTGGHHALVAGMLVQTGYGERAGQAPRALDVQAPLGTVVAGGVKHAVAAAFFEQANGGFYDGDGRSALDPLSTICTSGANQRLVTAYLVKYYGTGGQWQGLDEPMHTVPTRDRMGMVQVVHLPADALTDAQRSGAKRCAAFLHEHLPEQFPELVDAVLVDGYVLVDITLRMLDPRELARAQGFPDSYVIDRGMFEVAPGVFEERPISKTDQVRLIGNSVCPPEAEALVAANAADLIAFYRQQEAA